MINKVKSLTATAVIGLMVASPATAQDQEITDAERRKIEQVIVDLLEAQPEIVIGAIQEFQRRRQLASMLPQIKMYRGYLENEPNAPVLGNPDGDVTIVEFFDYRCGFCRRHFPEVMKLVQADGNIRLIPRQFPILDKPGQPAVSRIAARAALAAHKQDKFEEFHIALMAAPGQLNEDRIYQIAGQVGLDIQRLKADMADKVLDKGISNTLAIGQDIGFTGTPGYIIGDNVVLGAEGFESLKATVERARKQKQSGR